ncbi:MAG: prepilin peptidase [Planctomycetota bacterium]|nr:MAG: prepilin peptidase [Planctomycetota bacterium]
MEASVAIVLLCAVAGLWYGCRIAASVFVRSQATDAGVNDGVCWFCDAPLPRHTGPMTGWLPCGGSRPSACRDAAGAVAKCRYRRVARSAGMAAVVVASGFAAAYLLGRCQEVTEVRPDRLWWWGRLFYHELLLALLLWATLTDLRDYTIPDHITLPGIGVAVALAWASGDLQMIHLWVDWNDPLVKLHGPRIPEWIRAHRHWHGLAWSVSGAATGAVLIQILRWLSRWILGRTGLGSGDVTLLAMIGAFLGWQATVVVFLLAPFTALFVGAFCALIGRPTVIPYGPHLALSAWLVMMGWRWIWTFEPTPVVSVRRLFGDGPALAILGTVGLATAAVLLLGIRIYRSLPVRRLR